MMKLRALLDGAQTLEIHADLDMEVKGVSYDSRTTQPGDVFVAMVGVETDGHAYISKAVAAGAAAVVCQRPPQEEITYIRVENARKALAIMGDNFFGHPSRDMTMVAVTGTNGKTSTTYLLKALLEQGLGAKVGLIGTIQNLIGQEVVPSVRTTPESFELQRLLAQMRDGGCTHVVMEVSSHALAQDRVYGVHYAVGIFTNLTQEHLDYHKTMEAYCDAKAILFRQCDTGVVNADDPWLERLLREATCKVVRYSTKTPCDLWAENIHLAQDHITFTALTPQERADIRVNIPGKFMVYNTLDVIGGAMALGVTLQQAAQILPSVPHVKGRMEVVPTPGKDYTVLIDYAHTPDGLENLLSSVRGFAKGHITVLFGCGGDRDRSTRPERTRLAARMVDQIVLTTDNPRTEDLGQIFGDMLEGLKDTTTPYVIIEDRAEAIGWAMDHAGPGDVVVLCGKGHESYQDIQHVKHHFDEREVVAAYLQRQK